MYTRSIINSVWNPGFVIFSPVGNARTVWVVVYVAWNASVRISPWAELRIQNRDAYLCASLFFVRHRVSCVLAQRDTQRCFEANCCSCFYSSGQTRRGPTSPPLRKPPGSASTYSFFLSPFLHRRREPRRGKIRRLHRRREPGGGQPFIDRTHSVCLWKVDNAAAFSRFVRGNVWSGSAIVRPSRQFPFYTRIVQSFALPDGLSRSFPSMRYLGYEFLAVPLVGDVSRVFLSACRRMNFLNRFELDTKKRFSGDLWSQCHSTIKKMRFNFTRLETGRICWKTDK